MHGWALILLQQKHDYTSITNLNWDRQDMTKWPYMVSLCLFQLCCIYSYNTIHVLYSYRHKKISNFSFCREMCHKGDSVPVRFYVAKTRHRPLLHSLPFKAVLSSLEPTVLVHTTIFAQESAGTAQIWEINRTFLSFKNLFSLFAKTLLNLKRLSL